MFLVPRVTCGQNTAKVIPRFCVNALFSFTHRTPRDILTFMCMAFDSSLVIPLWEFLTLIV